MARLTLDTTGIKSPLPEPFDVWLDQ